MKTGVNSFFAFFIPHHVKKKEKKIPEAFHLCIYNLGPLQPYNGYNHDDDHHHHHNDNNDSNNNNNQSTIYTKIKEAS